MILYKNICAFILLSSVVIPAIGQSFSHNEYLKAAREAFSLNDNFAVAKYYDKASKYGSDLGSDDLYKYATAAYNADALELADSIYSLLALSDDQDHQKDLIYKKARIQHRLGNYEGAIAAYNNYNAEFSGIDDNLDGHISFLVESAKWALQGTNDRVSIKELNHLSFPYNTEFSDYAAVPYEGDIMYTSKRFRMKKDKKKRYTSKLLSKGNEVYLEGEGLEGKLVSSISHYADNQAVISLCSYTDDNTISCDLYDAIIQGDVVMVNSPITNVNTEHSTTTHPFVMGDMLYFSSDREGGLGGMDIWSANLDGSNLKNITDANTSGDEITPSMAQEILYFSSNHKMGYGGYDVYMLDGSTAVNVGPKINTAQDELFFIKSENYALFSSNKAGSKFINEYYQTCCYDIYRADLETQLKMMVEIRDKSNQEGLENATYTIREVATGEVIDEMTHQDFNYSSIVKPNTEYEIVGQKEGFTIDRKTFVTPASGEIVKKLYLIADQPMVIVKTFDAKTKQPLTFTSIRSSGDLMNTFNANGSNQVSFEGNINGSYQFDASAAGYNSNSASYIIKKLKGSHVVEIYLNKAVQMTQTLANLIPVRLYFDNDYPNPNTRRTTSSDPYKSTYNAYYSKKTEFVSNYSTNPSAADSFFENELRGGYEKLDRFMIKLQKVLESGQSVNLFIRGFASPLSPSDYNEKLTKRRIDSVEKDIRSHNGGSLTRFLNSEQLKITHRAFGEETSSSSVSDDPSRPKESIYHPDACRERRVEIDEIKFN